MSVMGRPIVDLTNQRFGRLTVLRMVPRDEWRRDTSEWVCRCDCGTEKAAIGYLLKSGRTKSCGCLRGRGRERSHGHAVRDDHGNKSNGTYSSWQNMKSRCFNENASKYAYYGGRGITVCDEWVSSFETFLADMGERPEGTSIDRIDPDGNYEPGNCRWATSDEQFSNTRRKRLK